MVQIRLSHPLQAVILCILYTVSLHYECELIHVLEAGDRPNHGGAKWRRMGAEETLASHYHQQHHTEQTMPPDGLSSPRHFSPIQDQCHQIFSQFLSLLQTKYFLFVGENTAVSKLHKNAPSNSKGGAVTYNLIRPGWKIFAQPSSMVGQKK